MKKYAIYMLIAAALIITGCGTTVERVDTDEVIDLSGRWNDTDSRMVSEEMIKDSLERPWLGTFKSRHGGKAPVVIVGTVRNLSHEHISVETFVKDLERALINSGQVEFVSGRAERDEIREEREEQAVYSSPETIKAVGEEIGADYMLKGSISSILDKEGGKAVMFYQVNLELHDIETNKVVWIGEKKLKKYVKRGRLGL
ncbi:MAG: penicillin-binding protein activator LpoB [Nitrospirota bacterium]|nr:MAG: penicillin-binding protein activator LpoB [Nitrospirota bacterium]